MVLLPNHMLTAEAYPNHMHRVRVRSSPNNIGVLFVAGGGMDAGRAERPDALYSHVTLPVRGRLVCTQVCPPPSPCCWRPPRGPPHAPSHPGTLAPALPHEFILVGSFQNMHLGSCWGEEDTAEKPEGQVTGAQWLWL